MLQLRCAVQRRELAQEFKSIEVRLQSVDRGVAFARGALLHPAGLVGGLIGLVVIWRTKGFRLLGRGLLLAAAARRVLRIARRLY